MLIYSVIVPVYNAEKQLDECIESILTQRTSSKYEVILVDDGSSDKSGEICDEYASRYPSVNVIHQVNQGVSVARNTGLAAAQGQYVLFLDGDDYWSVELLAHLDLVIPRNPDIVEFGYQKIYEDHTRETILPAIIPQGESGNVYLDRLFENALMPIASSCTSAYRRKFLVDEGIVFPTGVTYGEDFEFRMQCLARAQAVFGIGEPLYQYRMHEESAIHTPSLKKTHDLFMVCSKIYRLNPSGVLADYYCMNILWLAKLERADAGQLSQLLHDNRDILDHVSSRKARIARALYRIFGWYLGSKLVEYFVRLKHFGKVKE